MMTGVYRGHAFLIKDLEKVTKLFECAHCNARFTKSCDLSRQAERCTDGPAKIICPWNKVWAPKYFYERAFHPRGKYGRAACYLFEAESVSIINCVDTEVRGLLPDTRWMGITTKSRTVFQFHSVIFKAVQHAIQIESKYCTRRKEKT